jgi:large subunit ribosomal protein L25
VTTENTSVAVEAEATAIPESIEVSVDGLEIGSQIHAKDLTLPSGTTLAVDPELLVVNITAATTAEELEAELAEAEAELGIEHEEPEAPEAEAVEGEGAEGAPAEEREGAQSGSTEE